MNEESQTIDPYWPEWSYLVDLFSRYAAGANCYDSLKWLSDFVHVISASHVATKLSAKSSHETLMIAPRSVRNQNPPFVTVTPLSDGRVELRLRLDCARIGDPQSFPVSEAQPEIFRWVQRMLEMVDQTGYQRGFWLVSDVEEFMIETQRQGVQEKFVALDKYGNLKARGLTDANRFRGDLFVLKSSILDFVSEIERVDAQWLGLTQEFRKVASPEQSRLKLAFRLRNAGESALTFISAESEPSAPKEILEFVSGVFHRGRLDVEAYIKAMK